MPLARRTFVVCAALLSTIVDPASSRAEPELDRATFLRRFRASDARFEALRARADAAEGAVREAGALPNPSVRYQREEVFDDGEGVADQFATLGWSIDLSGARSRRTSGARAARDAARRESESDALEVTLAGLDRFHRAAYHRLRADVLHESRATLATLVDTVRAREGKGDASGADLDRALIELGAHDDLLAAEELDLAQARAELARLVAEPAGAVDAARSALDLPDVPASATLVDDARARRPDRLAELDRARAAEREAAAASRGWVPGLSLEGGLKTSDLGDRTATGYVVGLGLTIPLFDRGQGARVRAEAEARQHAAAARALDASIAADVRAAHAALAGLVARARTHERDIAPRAAALVAASLSAYREGERSLFELLDAYRTERDARLRTLELRLAARRAELELLRATGRNP